MNLNNNNRGSVWRKWDLHIHSTHSAEPNAKMEVKDILEKAVQHGISVIAITDHTNVNSLDELWEQHQHEFIMDGIKYKYSDFIEFLPGVELKTNKGYKPIHMIVVFPKYINVGTINRKVDTNFLKTEFLAKIGCSEMNILTAGSGDYNKGLFEKAVDFELASKQASELGGLVIIHASDKHGSIENGMSHAQGDEPEMLLNTLGAEKERLMTEFVNICEIPNWNSKNLKNRDFYLECLNKPSIVCSDAHNDYDGSRYTWIKADPCLEGLKQIIYEPESRIYLGENPPIEPLYKIEKVLLNFPNGCTLGGDSFCLEDSKELYFSPNFTCLIGGRGTGKSSVLNLIHNKLKPLENSFFNEHRLTIPGNKQIADCVNIDNDDDEKFIEFLSQNEVEIFAKDQTKFTQAIYNRLLKLDNNNLLSTVVKETAQYVEDISDQLERLLKSKSLDFESEKLNRELQTNRKIIRSFQNFEYVQLRESLTEKNQKIQTLITAKGRLNKLVDKLKNVIKEYPLEKSILTDNEYDKIYTEIIQVITEKIAFATGNTFKFSTKEEEALQNIISNQTMQMNEFLQKNGVSAENSRDLSIANEKIASLEKQLQDIHIRQRILQEEINGFILKKELKERYDNHINEMLDQINQQLRLVNSSDVKLIELRYEFDSNMAKEHLVDLVISHLIIGELIQPSKNKPRHDHIFTNLLIIDPLSVNDHFKFLDSLNKDNKTGKMLFDFFSEIRNFESYKLQIEKIYADTEKFKKIMVLYDGKPLAKSSFGQRCTAAIIVLLLLGNTPIIIDEPETHLDSSLIARYLVELIKKQKNQRQIVFATHNANFVINGDAELVHILNIDDVTGKTQINSTTIENLEYRQRLLMLEGGKIAFKKREQRY